MIKWITDNLGTAAYMDAISIDGKFNIVDVRNLVDKEGNRPIEIAQKIQEGVELINSGRKVVVCCDYGMSRSNTIAVGILSKIKKLPLSVALKKVMDKTNEKEIKLEMLESLWEYDDIKNKQYYSDGEKSVLITGASGFIGVELLKLLESESIKILTPSSSEIDIAKDHVLLDLMVKENHVDTIVHLANPRIYTTYEAFGKSLTMLKTILDVCVTNNVRLIFLSSWVIFGGYKGTLLANEELPPCAKDSYSHTKMLAEKLIESYEMNKKLSAVILRPCSIYGIGKDSPKFIWNFVDKCRKNQEIITHQYINGSPKLDLLHVSDLVQAIKIVTLSDDTGIYNIGGGISISTEDVARILVKKTESKSTISHTVINDYAANIIMDSSKFSKKYGWYPKVSLEDGLDEILRF